MYCHQDRNYDCRPWYEFNCTLGKNVSKSTLIYDRRAANEKYRLPGRVVFKAGQQVSNIPTHPVIFLVNKTLITHISNAGEQPFISTKHSTDPLYVMDDIVYPSQRVPL